MGGKVVGQTAFAVIADMEAYSERKKLVEKDGVVKHSGIVFRKKKKNMNVAL